MSKSKENLPSTALDVLQNMLTKGNSPLAEDFKRYRLKLDWPGVVGQTISEKCSPVGYFKGVLFVHVVNSGWMTQLHFVKKEMIKKINAYAAEKWVKDIRFIQKASDLPTEAQT